MYLNSDMFDMVQAHIAHSFSFFYLLSGLQVGGIDTVYIGSYDLDRQPLLFWSF